MHHHSGKVLRLHFPGPAAHGHVPEPLKREMRLINLRPSPLGRVANLFLRRTQILGIEIPGTVQHLRVPQSNRRPGRCRHAELHPAHHVLPHVDDRVACWCLQYFRWLDLFDLLYRGPCLRHDFGLRRVYHRYAFPFLIVVSGFFPSRFLQPRVVHFSVINVGLQYRSSRRFPVVVGSNNLLRPIRVPNHQLRQQR